MRELLYGRHPVWEALQAGRRRIYKLTLAQGAQIDRGVLGQIVAAAREVGAALLQAQRHELTRACASPNHQGVVAEFSPYPYVDLSTILNRAIGEMAATPPLLLLLDLLQDPQNVGSLLRTAEAVGVHGVVLPKRRAVGVTPAVVSASAGAVEWLQVAQVTNLNRAIDELKERGLWIVGLEADPAAEFYDQVDLSGPLALVVGSEGQGLRRLVREKCDLMVRLPMQGRLSSLNAAVAGSVVLYQVLQARRRPGSG